VRKILAVTIASCYCLTDSLSVFVFFFSSLGPFQAFIALASLMITGFVNQFPLFYNLIYELSQEKTLHSFIKDKNKQFGFWRSLSPLEVIIGGALGVFYLFMLMSSQLFSTYIFLSTHFISVANALPIAMTIVAFSGLGNMVKFLYDANVGISVLYRYYLHLDEGFEFSDKSSQILYGATQLVTGISACLLGYYATQISYQSIQFLMLHSTYFYPFYINPITHSLMAFSIIPTIAMLAMSTFLRMAIRVNYAVLNSISGSKLIDANISYAQVSALTFNALARTVSSNNTNGVPRLAIFSSGLVSDLNDIEFPTKLSKRNQKNV